jgi:hypothetical protein
MRRRRASADVLGVWRGERKVLLSIQGSARVVSPPLRVARSLDPGMTLTVSLDSQGDIAGYTLPKGARLMRGDLANVPS